MEGQGLLGEAGSSEHIVLALLLKAVSCAVPQVRPILQFPSSHTTQFRGPASISLNFTEIESHEAKRCIPKCKVPRCALSYLGKAWFKKKQTISRTPPTYVTPHTQKMAEISRRRILLHLTAQSCGPEAVPYPKGRAQQATWEQMFLSVFISYGFR